MRVRGSGGPSQMFGDALRMTGRHCNLRAERPVICNSFSHNRGDKGRSALSAERIGYAPSASESVMNCEIEK